MSMQAGIAYSHPRRSCVVCGLTQYDYVAQQSCPDNWPEAFLCPEHDAGVMNGMHYLVETWRNDPLCFDCTNAPITTRDMQLTGRVVRLVSAPLVVKKFQGQQLLHANCKQFAELVSSLGPVVPSSTMVMHFQFSSELQSLRFH